MPRPAAMRARRPLRAFASFTLVLFCALPAFARAEETPLQISKVAPARSQTRDDLLFVDFGKAAFGNLQIDLAAEPAAPSTLTIRLGEKLASDGVIDRRPPGSVNYRELTLALRPGQKTYRLQIPSKPAHLGRAPVKPPVHIGEITPFRYVEIEGAPPALDASGLVQLFVHAPFDDQAARFECSDAALNAVWALCHHTMKATTAFGVYIDGERERIPYEADAYINQLSHYACDLDPRVARATFAHLLRHPTWPTEWSLHMPMMAAADYLATGEPALAAAHWEPLKRKLLREKARSDGLLRATAIVDWPSGERDGYDNGRPAPGDRRQIGPEINTVANAFYYHALRETALLARALDKNVEADQLETSARRVRDAFNRVFFDPARRVYLDGEGSSHASLHANMFPLAFGLVPEEHVGPVADFVVSRGMACSVYGAQYLLEALFAAGRSDAALKLLASREQRGWWHMIELGSTMTLEAWDAKYKRNLTWNHAWGAAPANIVSRFVLGVQPLRPGYAEILVKPRLGGLGWARGRVPTPLGPVEVDARDGDVFELELTLPPGARTRIDLPRRNHGEVTVDGKIVPASTDGTGMAFEIAKPGSYRIQSR